jgi:hypothetical protein
MPEEVKTLFSDMRQQVVKVLATSSKDFRVNAVPIASMIARDDETLMFADMFLHKTKANLNENPKVAVAAFKPPNTGYQIKGTLTEWVTSGPLFKMMGDMIFQQARVSIKGLGIIKVEEVYSISPVEAGERLA